MRSRPRCAGGDPAMSWSSAASSGTRSACASIVTPAAAPIGWWAVGVSNRGLELPEPLLAQLRRAASDLASTFVS